MKLSVSNIAWNCVPDRDEDEAVLALLLANGATGIEVAPTKLWPGWDGATESAAKTYRNRVKSLGFEIPALQAILFEKPHLQLFGDASSRSQLLQHIEQVAILAAALGAGKMVFGSPRNRDRGDLSIENAFALAAEFFSRAGRLCAKHSTQLCIEPNPASYQCNFLTSWREVLDMVDAVDEPGIGLHLDTACIEMAGDNVVDAITECRDRICHFHISEPNLSDLSIPTLDHARIGKALKQAAYAGWHSIEMRRSNDPLTSIRNSLQLVLRLYD